MAEWWLIKNAGEFWQVVSKTDKRLQFAEWRSIYGASRKGAMKMAAIWNERRDNQGKALKFR